MRPCQLHMSSQPSFSVIYGKPVFSMCSGNNFHILQHFDLSVFPQKLAHGQPYLSGTR